ncbi:uncharacterized protein EV420DRAFT_1581530 [Desarmillaria tabescens]|uniref:Uncharacterized protein n=1 Tax=Armillaria tabescens TaxID=1929756 RepID=A0AA39JDB9_ARMTA|nr:uncharacterized protein EV420DRAFT_1581530 [Desarmillaria tabescens]KAK0440695.1 hypothetical protein EV420DRAFT_1581530 [Desarmillaria tabescens]
MVAPLKNKIIPTRNAAKKASSSFSSQLDDSPVNSEDEYERPSRQRGGTGRGRGRERGSGSRRGRGKSTRSTSFHKASRSKAASTRSLSSVSRLSTSFEMPWSLDGLGNYVWVLVSSAGSVFQEEDEKEYIWWPAKKHRLIGHQLTLIPFGNLNPPDAHLSYWPAKVLEYVPPVSRNQKAGKYKVLYLDGAMQTILRTWFKCLGDEEFGTCKLGEFESTAINNDPNNNDDDSMMGQPHDREPSPVPSIPPPSSSDFIYLSIREQFCYTKPAHVMFMAGGKARKILNQNAGERGTVIPNDVERLMHSLLPWVLRDEMVARRITDDRVEETAPDDAATPQNTAEVVSGATRDTGTTVNSVANGVPHNVDGDRTPIVGHEVEAEASISQAEGESPTSPSTFPVSVQEGEVPSTSSQPASEAPTVRVSDAMLGVRPVTHVPRLSLQELLLSPSFHRHRKSPRSHPCTFGQGCRHGGQDLRRTWKADKHRVLTVPSTELKSRTVR